MYKLIACDLDDTLLKSDTRLPSPNDCQTIKEAVDKGLIFVLASGRGYTTFQNIAKLIGTYQKENQYMMSYNGSIISCNKNNQVVHFDEMDLDIVDKLYQLGQNYDVDMHVYTEKSVFAYNLFEDDREYQRGRMDFIETEDKTLGFIDGPVTKILYSNADMEYLRSIEKELAFLKDDINITYSSGRYLEFNKKGVNKGSGLKWLADYLQIDLKDTIAVGDNFNDLPMIEIAGLGIGVKNTHKDMIDLCDHITKATNNDDPLTEIIKEYL